MDAGMRPPSDLGCHHESRVDRNCSGEVLRDESDDDPGRPAECQIETNILPNMPRLKVSVFASATIWKSLLHFRVGVTYTAVRFGASRIPVSTLALRTD